MAVEPTNGKCYCCIDPRTGVIVIAVLHISGALGVLYLIGALAVEGHIMLWGPITELIVGFMAGASLLYGAIKYNTAAIIIHIVLAVIEIIIFLVVSILFTLFAFAFEVPSLADHIIFLGSPVVIVSILIYFIVQVYKFYKEIKSGTIIPA